MSESNESKKASSNSYVVVSIGNSASGVQGVGMQSTAVSVYGKVIGSWSNRDKAVRQAFETSGMTAIQVFNPVSGELIETITKG